PPRALRSFPTRRSSDLPTRVVIAGGPDLGSGPLADRAKAFRERFDTFRSCVVNEPRGSDVLVGALLCEPHEPGCAAGVIFFNNVDRKSTRLNSSHLVIS